MSTTKLLDPILNKCIESGFETDNNSKLIYTILSMDMNRFFKQYKDSITVTGNLKGKKEEFKRLSEIQSFIINRMSENFINKIPDYNSYKTLFKLDNISIYKTFIDILFNNYSEEITDFLNIIFNRDNFIALSNDVFGHRFVKFVIKQVMSNEKFKDFKMLLKQ